jgi:hypothetical protein
VTTSAMPPRAGRECFWYYGLQNPESAPGQTEKNSVRAHIFRLLLNPDIARRVQHVSNVPNPEVVASFNHLVGAGQHRGRDDEVEGLSNS